MTLGMLKNPFACRDIGLKKQLNVSMVRPQLEYVVKIKKVKRRATNIPNGLKNMEYSNRLDAFKLTILEKRRTRGDLV